MGVPKFFRYISERYPCLSELIKEHEISDFDNMYLDMNGIIHTCSHPDDSNPHFRITEERIFAEVFRYIGYLFQLIRPKKLFYMAIDGVAPRAKMNQQRGRRFRSAREAEQMEAKARENGEVLPTDKRFDSNCITPGTVFMARLHEQLRYFVKQKITTDKAWASCKIVLSGHETPGEGEHKIMDYIRYLKTQPDHDPNTRHCLYGMDADLIMLGLCSHEPNFSLLREEVKFGKHAKKASTADEANFYLLHLSLMRDYLEQEFLSLKEQLSFEYDLERIIDDWVLMGFLVGNDFIPPLPNLHIHTDSLPILYNTYKTVLPQLQGYINEGGKLNLERFEKFLLELSTVDRDNFQEAYADLKFFQDKTGRRPNEKERKSYNHVPNDADTFDVDVEEIKSGNPLPMSEFKSDLDALIAATDDMALDEDLDKELECFNIDEDMDSEENEESQFRFEFSLHKRDYYMNKLEFAKVTPEVLRSQAECYVRAIQWVLNYYYQGCASWSWFYPHHYAPYISDVVNFTDMDLKFDMAQPLRPFEQLLAVLPAASKDLLPTPFHSLMTSDTSPIHVYYPIEFETDLNGKKNEWEAIVLIPFIDEGNLLSAIKPCYDLLTPDEIKRNTFGPMLMYDYTSQNMGEVVSPAYFPKISECHAVETRVWNEDICVPPDKVVRGPLPNPLSHMYFPGVPTFKHLPFKAEFVKAKVKVFDFPSRNDNVIIHVEQKPQEAALEEVATQLLGHIVWVGWPHLTKAKVMSIADEEFIFTYTTSGSAVSILKEEMHKPKWDLQKQSIEAHHMCRLGIDVGDITTVVNCAPITGYQYVLGGEGQLVYKENWSHITSPYALHMVLPKLAIAPGSGSKRFRRLQDAFPAGDTAFLLSGPYYACMAQVIDSSLVGAGNGRIKISVLMEPEPDISPPSWRHWRNRYMQPRVAAAKCGISSLMLARLTSSIFVIPGDKVDAPQKSIRGKDIGLNLKFTKKNEETTGYTHQEQNRWSYSERCVDLINAYSGKFHGMFMRMEKLMNRDSVYERELFPDPEEGSLEEVLAWLKEQPHKDSSIRECGTECLDPEEMIYIRNLVDSQLGGADVDTSKRITLQVKPHILFKPELHSGNVPPDPLASKYMMYDRVVNVNPSSMVPLGYRGTVTGISNLKSTVETVKISDKYNTEPVYRILFDKSFPGGNNTDGITGNRFYNMLGYNLLNMSHGRANHEKANDKVTIKQPNVDVPPASQNNNLRANDGHHSAFANYTSPTKNQMSNSFNKPPSSFVSQPPAAVQLKPKVEYPQPAMPKEDPRTQMLRSMLRIDDKQQKLPQDAQPPHARPQKQVVPPKHQDRPVQQMSPQKLPRNELLSKIAPQFSQPKQQQSEAMQQMLPPKQVQNQAPPQMLMPQFLQQQQSQLMQQMPPTSKPMQQMLPSKQQQNQQMPPLNQLQNQPMQQMLPLKQQQSQAMQQMLPLKQQQSQAMQQMPPSSQSLIHTLPLNQHQSQPMQQMLPPKQQQNQPPQVQQPPRQQAQQQRTGGGGGSAYQSSQQAFLNALLAAPQNNQLPFPAMLVTTDNNKSAPTIAASAPPAGPNNKVISTPFVPLQAVTRQRNVSSSAASKNYKKGFHKTTLVPAANSPAVPAAPANHTEVIQDPEAKNVTKKKTRRSKKSRIAANFGQVQ